MKPQKDISFSYAQRQRIERIFACGDFDSLDTLVLLALNYYSKKDGTDMRASAETLEASPRMATASHCLAAAWLALFN